MDLDAGPDASASEDLLFGMGTNDLDENKMCAWALGMLIVPFGTLECTRMHVGIFALRLV